MAKSQPLHNLKACLLCEEVGHLDVLPPPSKGNWGPQPYFQCQNCGFIFLDPVCYLSAEAEKKRYELHQNSNEDAGYLVHLNPVLEEVENCPPGAFGLDFGSGKTPVLADLIAATGRKILVYDPFFHPLEDNLKKRYDFVVCTEVIEHFHNPRQDFSLLRSLLHPGGALIVMTQLLPEKDFYHWWYRRDPTHVGFYSEKSLQWIKETFHFQQLDLKSRSLVTFKA